MRNKLFDVVEDKYRRSEDLDFEIGDTARVTIRIIEGGKERLQDYEGTIIARRGEGLDEMFTVRRIVGDEGVERIFPIHSPKIVRIRTVRHGRVRRCKLYYLRDRVGKARKLRERRTTAQSRIKSEQARAAKDQPAAEASVAAVEA